jgi:hypothetical protein
MAVKSRSLLGGESVYCINEVQLKEATRLATEDPQSAPRLQKLIKTIEEECSRNEQAALAFTLIERLRSSKG